MFEFVQTMGKTCNRTFKKKREKKSSQMLMSLLEEKMDRDSSYPSGLNICLAVSFCWHNPY